MTRRPQLKTTAVEAVRTKASVQLYLRTLQVLHWAGRAGHLREYRVSVGAGALSAVFNIRYSLDHPLAEHGVLLHLSDAPESERASFPAATGRATLVHQSADRLAC